MAKKRARKSSETYRLLPGARASVPLDQFPASWQLTLLHSKSSFILLLCALNPGGPDLMIRGRKFPVLPSVLIHSTLECAFRIREMSRNRSGRFRFSSFLILNFLQLIFKFLIHPSFFRFLSSQLHCSLHFLLPSALQLPSLSAFSSTLSFF